MTNATDLHRIEENLLQDDPVGVREADRFEFECREHLRNTQMFERKRNRLYDEFNQSYAEGLGENRVLSGHSLRFSGHSNIVYF